MTTSPLLLSWLDQLKASLRSAPFLESEPFDFHRFLAPELAYGRHRGPCDTGVKHAAVILLLYATHEHWTIPLTLRHRDLPDHAGQISLPGGRIEAGESEWDSAVRELEEELGVSRKAIEYLGRLPPIHVFASNHLVQPFVAYSAATPLFIPNPCEVEEVIEFVLPREPWRERIEQRTLNHRRVEWKVPGFAQGPHFIWGATAMILESFLDVHSKLRA